MRRSRRILLAVLAGMVAVSSSATGVSSAAATSSAANPEHVDRFRKTRECPGCDLSKANLAGFQGINAVLRNADLTDATLYGGSLRGADLTGAFLDGTNLERVDLTGAIGAILTNAKTDERTTCPDGNAGPCS